MVQRTLISVVIPVFNGQEFIAETLESVIAQNFCDWELIVVNDGSTDNTAAIVQQYVDADDRVSAIHLGASSGGPARARNVGIEVARGEYVAFLDADDTWHQEKLEKQLRFIEDEELDIVGCNAYFVDSLGVVGDESKRKISASLITLILGSALSLQIINPLFTSSSLVKRDPLVRFREDPVFHAIEDWFLWIDLSLQGWKYGVLEEPLFCYRLHDASLSSVDGERQYRKHFSLYSTLFIEGKIGLLRLLVLCSFQSLKILRYRYFGRHFRL